jgi:hypothetical protein
LLTRVGLTDTVGEIVGAMESVEEADGATVISIADDGVTVGGIVRSMDGSNVGTSSDDELVGDTDERDPVSAAVGELDGWTIVGMLVRDGDSVCGNTDGKAVGALDETSDGDTVGAMVDCMVGLMVGASVEID